MLVRQVQELTDLMATVTAKSNGDPKSKINRFEDEIFAGELELWLNPFMQK